MSKATKTAFVMQISFQVVTLNRARNLGSSRGGNPSAYPAFPGFGAAAGNSDGRFVRVGLPCSSQPAYSYRR